MLDFAQKIPLLVVAHCCLLLPLSFASTIFQKKPASEKGHFEWTPSLREAYLKATSLRFGEAEKDLAVIRAKDPNNLLILHVENYLDFFRVFLNEEEEEFKKLEKNKDKRIEQIQSKGDPNSPYYLFLQADIRLQWVMARLKFEQSPTAFFETNRAFKLLTSNDEKFPDFMPNKKDLGILHAMAGTIPDSYKWAVGWLTSMEGTISEGKNELQQAIDYAQKNDFIYEQEIYVYYAFLLLYLDNDSEEAWRVINTSKLKPASNPMACFVLANVAMRTDRGDEAIAILKNRPTGQEYHPFYFLDYMTGLAKLRRLDLDAGTYFQRFVDKHKGKNFIKDAYQKMAWICLLNGDLACYYQKMALCKTKGATIVGSDRSANDEAKRNEIPVVDLLKARLLFDGGHFSEANEILEDKKPSDFMARKNQLEYTYRMGRIAHKLKRYTEALQFYQKTINDGKSSPWYFACRAALEKGLILEKQKDAKGAKEAYKLCLSLSPDDHKAALHQQAKAGLRRLKA